MDTYEPDRVVISGSSGLIGTALVEALRQRGTPIIRLVRARPRAADEVFWDPSTGSLDPRVLEGAAAVINLGGASISRLPWTENYRRTILRSRLEPTGTLVRAISKLRGPRPAFLSASAVGYYGSAPGRELTENSPAGDTFLANVCVQWEKAAMRARPYTRVALLRTAPVVSAEGFLKPIIALAKLGAAGPLGPGTQFWPWISLADEIAAILHILDREIEGPVNLTGPHPARADDLIREVAHELNRPFWFPTPAWLLRAMLGKVAADSLLLADAQLLPRVLEESGFAFMHRTVESAVRAAM